MMKGYILSVQFPKNNPNVSQKEKLRFPSLGYLKKFCDTYSIHGVF